MVSDPIAHGGGRSGWRTNRSIRVPNMLQHRSAPWGHGLLTARGEPDPKCLIAQPESYFILGHEPPWVTDSSSTETLE